jgi:hypothetical protein
VRTRAFIAFPLLCHRQRRRRVCDTISYADGRSANGETRTAPSVWDAGRRTYSPGLVSKKESPVARELLERDSGVSDACVPPLIVSDGIAERLAHHSTSQSSKLDSDVTQRADLIDTHFSHGKVKLTAVVQCAKRRDLDLSVALTLRA